MSDENPNTKFPKSRHRKNFKRFQKHNNSNTTNKRKWNVTCERLLDEDIGITEYISSLDGFPAIMKARFSDFQVNEIDCDNRIVKYSGAGKVPEQFKTRKVDIDKVPNESPNTNLISQERWEAITNLAKSNNKDADTVNINVQLMPKDERRFIHHTIKDNFGALLSTDTVKIGDECYIRVKIPAAGERIINRWPDDIPEYVYFIVYKEHMDTAEATFKISTALKVPMNKITVAGVKDKRAKTTQWFCIKKIEPWKLLSKTYSIRFLRVGTIEFKTKALKLGDLKGNRFRIALRNVIADDELITRSVEQLKQFGFINYYGTQRFGNDRETPTYIVGLHLIRSEWKSAIDLILKVKPSDNPEDGQTKAKQHYTETSNAVEALKFYEKERSDTIEKKLLEGLAKCVSTDYVNALESIPRNIRLLYVHSFQSFVWNKMASKRIQLFGLKPQIGDLVYVDNFNESEETMDDTIEDLDESGTSCTDRGETPSKKGLVKALTADDIDKYTIYDIVLTCPGYDVIYPENMFQYYKEILEEYKLTPDMPKQSVKAYNICGTYRKLLSRVEDLSYQIIYYNDPFSDLIVSDLGELFGDPQPCSIENGQYKALILAFNLESCAYATMVLRELLKCNSSSTAQAKLNDYYTKQSDNSAVINKTPLVTMTDDKDEENIATLPMNSLLADKEKYAEFKKNLFNLTDKDVKGKLEMEENDEPACKKEKKSDEV